MAQNEFDDVETPPTGDQVPQDTPAETTPVSESQPGKTDPATTPITPENRVSALESELSLQQDKYLRLMAEFDNYKRRMAREYDGMVESANEKLMVAMIEVRENFDRALKSGNEASAAGTTFYDGMKLIFAKFDDVLTKNGLTVFTAIGDEFDPQIHDALMRRPDAEIAAGHVVDIYEMGYRLKDKVIRHARVIISEGPQTQEKE